jgi:hypothetical protein
MIKKINDNNIGHNPIKAWQSCVEFSSKNREQQLIQELILCIRYCYVEQEKDEKEEMSVYLTSRRVRLQPTMTSFPLPDGATSRCGPSDNEEEVPAAYVSEIDEVGLPP